MAYCLADWLLNIRTPVLVAGSEFFFEIYFLSFFPCGRWGQPEPTRLTQQLCNRKQNERKKKHPSQKKRCHRCKHNRCRFITLGGMVGDENKKNKNKNWSGTMKRRFWTQSCCCSKCTPTSFKVQSRQFKVQFKVKPRLSPKRCNETKNGTAEGYARNNVGFQVFSQSFLNVRKTPNSGTHNSVQCSTGEFNVQTNQFNAPTSFKVQHDIVGKKSGKETIPCWTAAHRASRRLKKTVAEQRTIPKGG